MPLTENVVASLPLCPAVNMYNNTNEVEEPSSDEENLDTQENSNIDQTKLDLYNVSKVLMITKY